MIVHEMTTHQMTVKFGFSFFKISLEVKENMQMPIKSKKSGSRKCYKKYKLLSSLLSYKQKIQYYFGPIKTIF